MSRVTWRKARSREPRSRCMHAFTSGARANGPGVSRRGSMDNIVASLGSSPLVVRKGCPCGGVRVWRPQAERVDRAGVAARTPPREAKFILAQECCQYLVDKPQ